MEKREREGRNEEKNLIARKEWMQNNRKVGRIGRKTPKGDISKGTRNRGIE